MRTEKLHIRRENESLPICKELAWGIITGIVEYYYYHGDKMLVATENPQYGPFIWCKKCVKKITVYDEITHLL